MRNACRIHIIPLLAVLFGLGMAMPATAEAQYFGRNKVQYDTFNFRILKTEHFDIYYYPEEETIIREAARMAERWYARIARVLDWELTSVQPLILYASHPEFEQTNAVFGFIGESTGGVTEALKRRIVLPLARPALMITALFSFMAGWSEFIVARVIVNSQVVNFALGL